MLPSRNQTGFLSLTFYKSDGFSCAQPVHNAYTTRTHDFADGLLTFCGDIALASRIRGR